MDQVNFAENLDGYGPLKADYTPLNFPQVLLGLFLNTLNILEYCS